MKVYESFRRISVVSIFGMLLFFSRAQAASEVVGFWDFKDGEPGENVSTVVNSVGDVKYTGTASKRDTADEKGRMPTFESDSPGSCILSSFNGEVLAVNPQSIKFGYDPSLINPDRADAPPGGRIDFPGIVDSLAGEAFTIEFFIKMDPDFEYYSANGNYVYNSKSACFFGENPDSGTIRGFKMIAPNGVKEGKIVTGFAMQVFNNKSWADVAISNDGSWRHIAMVYDGKGLLHYYCNYAESDDGAIQYDNSAYTGTRVFCLGTGRNYEEMQGWISCLRITKGALGTDGFMRVDNVPKITTDGTVGFYDFKDGKVGDAADVLRNSAMEGVFDGKAALVVGRSGSAKGILPVFSDEKPGSMIYAGSSMSQKIAIDPQSLYFSPGTSSGGGGKVMLADLSSSLSKLQSYTIELFFKPESTATYRTIFGWRMDATVGFKTVLVDGSQGCDITSGALQALTNNNGTIQNLGYVSHTSNSSYTTNRWHHLAVVCDAENGKMKMYVDYGDPVSVDYDARTTFELFPVTIGTSAFLDQEITEAFCGFIACPRITARALEKSEFMVARRFEVQPNTVFAWNFEEGETCVGQKIEKALDYAASAQDSALLSSVYCLDTDTLPEYYASSKSGRDVEWAGDRLWTNNFCCWFQGRQRADYLPAYAGTEMNKPASNLESQNPESWTMEAFVKREFASYSQDYGALLFGKMGNLKPHSSPALEPRYCWMLTMLPDGRLKLFWTQADREVYEANSPSYKNATTAVACLADDNWHHIALTYDKSSRTFIVYKDYKPVMTQVVGGVDGYGLFDGPFGYFFSRMELTNGFEGWMDEIRFSSIVRTPESFVRFTPLGLRLMFK